MPAFVALALSSVAFGGGFPTFTDATDDRLVAAPEVGGADTAEKDFAVADFDNDGRLDVVVARRVGLNGNNGTALPNVLLMNEDGLLVDRTGDLAPDLLVARRSRDVVAADFDADGWIDVCVAEGPLFPLTLLMNRGESDGVWLGFAAAPALLPAALNLDAWTIAAGDLVGDDDGRPDLFVGTRNGNDRLLENAGAPGGVWAGFTDASARLGANASTSAVRSSEIVDINLDGDLDILQDVTNPTGAARILANDGAGGFAGAPQNVITSASYNFATGDLDGNGRLDMIGVRNGTDQYRLNTGSTGDAVTFAAAVDIPNTNGFGSIARVADLNGDDRPDVLICDLDQEFPQDCSRRLRIYFNNGAAPWLAEGYPVAQPWTPSGTSDVALLDLDGDGDLDMVIGHCSGTSIFLQDGPDAIPGDLDGDGAIGFSDLLIVLAAWGPCPPVCPEDLDGSGAVDFGDVLFILSNWS